MPPSLLRGLAEFTVNNLLRCLFQSARQELVATIDFAQAGHSTELSVGDGFVQGLQFGCAQRIGAREYRSTVMATSGQALVDLTVLNRSPTGARRPSLPRYNRSRT